MNSYNQGNQRKRKSFGNDGDHKKHKGPNNIDQGNEIYFFVYFVFLRNSINFI